MKRRRYIFSLIIFLLQSVMLQAQTDDATITIHLRGVYESKIGVIPLSGKNAFKPLAEVDGIRKGKITQLVVPKEYLPGEFVLRFDYKDKELSNPYPSEKNIFINDQDLELWINPPFGNNTDSTRFQAEEKENTAFIKFSKENAKEKQKIGLLQNFLMNYDATESDFYKQGTKEYEQRRQAYNQWLVNAATKDKKLFVSNTYRFHYIQQVAWKGSDTDRIRNVISSYFEGMDFSDPLIIKTADLNKWMDGYVNLYGQLSTSVALRDSLFPVAGRTAIEKAKQGNAQVYGWMVDYFYRGFEANAIDAGIKMLQPYIDDPNCPSNKKAQVGQRLQAMQSLAPGSIAPNIQLKDINNKPFDLNTYKSNTEYLLLLFWSAGCSHCTELVKELKPFYEQAIVQKKMELIAVSLDQASADIKAWNQYLPQLKTWKHLHATEGMGSKVARDYFILSTPQMFLVDAKTKQLLAAPNDMQGLLGAISGK